MSILDVTEDQIFHTLGKGKDPNFKPIEKARPVAPVAPRLKKTYAASQTIKQTIKPGQPQVINTAVEPERTPSPAIDESMKKLEGELCELNNRVCGIQTMVKWYIVPQFMIIVVLILALFIKS